MPRSFPPLLVLALSITLAEGGLADAGTAEPRLDPAVADPLELARMVERHGDGVVVRSFAAPQRALRLVAIRAAPYMRRPASVLVSLCEVLGSRDPELAPEAARAALAVAAGIHAHGLAGQDMLPAELAPARVALGVALERSHLRADIRRAAGVIDHALAESGVPPPLPPPPLP